MNVDYCVRCGEDDGECTCKVSDCQFNCRAKRREDFEAGWKAAQLFDESVYETACGVELVDAFEAHIEKNPARLSSYRRESEG